MAKYLRNGPSVDLSKIGAKATIGCLVTIIGIGVIKQFIKRPGADCTKSATKPPSRGETMHHSSEVGDKEVWCIQTDADCNDPTIGSLLSEYLLDTLNPQQASQIEAHIKQCELCQAKFENWRAIEAALKKRKEVERAQAAWR